MLAVPSVNNFTLLPNAGLSVVLSDFPTPTEYGLIYKLQWLEKI